MTKLNEILAVEKRLKAEAFSKLSEINKTMQRHETFNGFHKTYTPRDETGEKFPDENKLVLNSVPDLLQRLIPDLSEMYRTVQMKELGNTQACATLELDGMVFPDLPATFLLFLEKQFTDLITLIDNLPVLDAAETWNFDANNATFRTGSSESLRTKKENKVIVLYPATPEHPAQAQLVQEDRVVGTWQTTKISGAIPARQKANMRALAERYHREIVQTRERANQTEVQEANRTVFPALLARVFGVQ